MASTMPVCIKANSRHRGWRIVIATATAVVAGIALAAGFTVREITPQEVGTSLRLNGSVVLDLTAQVEEALSNGIPLDFVIDARLYRRRALIWDETLQTWRLRRHLYYHALSGQYVLGNDGVRQSRGGYSSLSDALRESGQLEDVVLPLQQPLAPDGDYRLGVRVSLDIEALPPLLRPVAYTSRAWDLNSGWTTWKVQR
jgi:hypothetical protein